MTRHRAGRALQLTVATGYALAAGVHLANMSGAKGGDWWHAPLSWQVIDVSYLALDLVAAAGLYAHRWSGVWAVLVTALSQIVLYTLLRSWVLDLPTGAAPAPSADVYLNTVVALHALSLVTLAVGVYLAPPERRGSIPI